jgi:hypothetical protein
MDDRLAKEYELLIRVASEFNLVIEEESSAVFFQKLETFELMHLLQGQNVEGYSEQLSKVKTNVAASLYVGVEQITNEVNEHSIPALIEALAKLQKARNSREVIAMIRLGLSVFKEEKILDPCFASRE